MILRGTLAAAFGFIILVSACQTIEGSPTSIGQSELEGEWEGEFESEEFFRRIGGFPRRAAPILRGIARVAAPIVGTAVGGPLGGMLGGVAATALLEP